jgi:predicted  nucleic acid-binding Zn-ribbon protein
MTRKEWIDVTKRKLDELDEALTGLEKRAADARDRTADELDARIRATRRGLTAAQERWASVKSSAADAWDNVSEEIGAAWETNKVALERSIEEIRTAVDSAKS